MARRRQAQPEAARNPALAYENHDRPTTIRAMTYLYLIGAIVFEVIGTSALQASEQFIRPKPLAVTAAGYAASFYLLSLALRTLPVGIAYAIWSGLGIVLIALVGLVLFGQKLDAPAIAGLALIVAGVGVINLFSSSVSH